MVGLVLFLLFLLVPVAELVVIFRVAGSLGWLDTIAILVVISVVGAWLVKRAGLRALIRTQTELAQGKVPTDAILDGLIVLVAGALMLTPGFLTDIVGLLLLLPPVRAAVRRLLVKRYRSRVASGRQGSTRVWTRIVRDGDFIDADSYEVNDRELDR